MDKIDDYLENKVCKYCFYEGMKNGGGDFYFCPRCRREYSIIDDAVIDVEIYTDKDVWYEENMICPECGESKCFDFEEDNRNTYVCRRCGHEGDIEDEISQRNVFIDMLEEYYGEEGMGEVFDND